MCNILVVDDEPIVLDVVAATLRKSGYEVVTAGSVSEALNQARVLDRHLHLLITNHSISRRSGSDLVEDLLCVQPQMRVLRFSGHSESELRESGEIRPESFFIQKPFQARQLLAKVYEIVGPPLHR